MKNEIVETKIGNNTQISTLETSFIVPESTIQAIANVTNDREEALELLSYLKERVDGYNASMETIGTEQKDKKFKYTPKFVEQLLVKLMSNGFVPEQIIETLDGIHDYVLFGKKDNSIDEDEIEARIDYINEVVKRQLNYTVEGITEEETYKNVDERIYNRG